MSNISLPVLRLILYASVTHCMSSNLYYFQSIVLAVKFLLGIVPLFEKQLLLFQTEEPFVHRLYPEMQDLLIILMKRLVLRNFVILELRNFVIQICATLQLGSFSKNRFYKPFSLIWSKFISVMFIPISLTQFQNFNEPVDDVIIGVIFATGAKLFVTFDSLVVYKGLWQHLSLNFKNFN